MSSRRAAEAKRWMLRMKIIKRQASIIVLTASLTTVCFSGVQERSNVPKPVIDQNLAIDYGSIFDKYDSKRSVKSRNESLKGGAEFLRLNPHLKAYLISYGGKVSYAGEAIARAEQIKNYLVKVLGVDSNRIEIIDAGHCNGWSVSLWVWARNAREMPTPPTCLDAKDVRIVRKRSKRLCTRTQRRIQQALGADSPVSSLYS
jgi:hypothetical protein